MLPLSDRLTPGIAAALPTPIACAAGTAITGSPFTVTAIVFGVALLPKLSLAFTVMVSGPARAVGVPQRRQVGVHRVSEGR